MSPCLTCLDGTLNKCFSCDKYGLLLGTSCVDQCDNGFYTDTTMRVCVACQSPCSQCSSSPTTCSSCILKYYLDGTQCKACPQLCDRCDQYSGAQCNDNGCQSQAYRNASGFCICNNEKFLLEGNCMSCPNGLYGDQDTNTCLKCPVISPTCLSKTLPVTCLTTKF